MDNQIFTKEAFHGAETIKRLNITNPEAYLLLWYGSKFRVPVHNPEEN
jgi:hypothetical protein